MRIFYHVCIVFISPPEVELCVLSLYFACFVRVFVLFIDETYCIHSAFSHLHARKHMLDASVVATNKKVNNTKHAKNKHKTRKHC